MSAHARSLQAVAGAAALLVSALAACAPLTPTPAPTAPPPVSGTPAPRPAAPQPGSGRVSAAPIDSTPSPEALKVLAGIPEPLPASQRVAAPTLAAILDTIVSADSGAIDIPVPAPTVPLGEQRPSIMDTTNTGAPAAKSAPAAPTATPPATSPAPGAPASPPATRAAPDTCWRVQVGAPLEAEEAEGLRAAASSQLLTTMVIEREAGRYKVRNEDCLSGEAAEQLRRRAVDSGFTQAFRTKTARR